MFVFKEKMVTTQSNYISIGMGEYYMYIQKNVYDKLNEMFYKYKSVEEFLSKIEGLTEEQKANCTPHLDKLRYPEAIMCIYGVLFSEGLKDLELEDYVGAISTLMSDTIVIRNTLEDLIKGDIQYSINVFEDYKFAKKNFELTCIAYQDLVSPKDIRESQFVFLKAYEHDARFGTLQMQTTPQVPQYQTLTPQRSNSDLSDWHAVATDPKARYAGYGEFYHDELGLISFDDDFTIEQIEKFLKWDNGEEDTEPIKTQEVEQAKEDTSYKPQEEYSEPAVDTVKHLTDLLREEGIAI